jgi:hypothetical protein
MIKGRHDVLVAAGCRDFGHASETVSVLTGILSHAPTLETDSFNKLRRVHASETVSVLTGLLSHTPTLETCAFNKLEDTFNKLKAFKLEAFKLSSTPLESLSGPPLQVS